jgi:hypothetical protein
LDFGAFTLLLLKKMMKKEVEFFEKGVGVENECPPP